MNKGLGTEAINLFKRMFKNRSVMAKIKNYNDYLFLTNEGIFIENLLLLQRWNKEDFYNYIDFHGVYFEYY